MPVGSNRRQDDNRGRLIAVQTQAIRFEALRQRKFYDVVLWHGFILWPCVFEPLDVTSTERVRG
jgi:hypothetical protein